MKGVLGVAGYHQKCTHRLLIYHERADWHRQIAIKDGYSMKHRGGRAIKKDLPPIHEGNAQPWSMTSKAEANPTLILSMCHHSCACDPSLRGSPDRPAGTGNTVGR
jgi:hypothetical protein